MSYIKMIQIDECSFPIDRPFVNHIRRITHINGIYIRIHTNAGIVGHAFIYGMSILDENHIVQYIKNDLMSALLQGKNAISNANELHSYWQAFWHSYKKNELSQEQLYALANIDIAVWDVFSKSNNISLHQYLGGSKSIIPVYGTTGWLSLSESELIDECKFYLTKKVSAFKVRIGHINDYLRLQALRLAVGDEVKLMLDANHRYSVEKAIETANLLSIFNIFWFEEPTKNVLTDIEKIKKSSPIPIALGENIFSEKDFESICKNHLTDYLQLDIPRCGGITGFCRIAVIAAQYNIPICNHLLYELSASLIAAYPNGFMLEYDTFLPPEFFKNDFSLKDGFMKPPEEIGNGVELKQDVLSKYSHQNENILF